MLAYNVCTALAFSNPSHHRRAPFGVVPNAPTCFTPHQCTHNNNINNARPASSTPLYAEKYEKVNEDDEQVIAFMDSTTGTTAGIDCYIDSYATVDGIEYTIGSPCDYAVALCYFGAGEDGDEQLVPIELDDPTMDDIFPIAEGIIEDEFGEELVLMRTPQTLTLVGVSFCYNWRTVLILCVCCPRCVSEMCLCDQYSYHIMHLASRYLYILSVHCPCAQINNAMGDILQELEESELDEDDEDFNDDDDLDEEQDDSDEEVEILVSFEEDGQEYHLVRLLDPVLLVGKVSI